MKQLTLSIMLLLGILAAPSRTMAFLLAIDPGHSPQHPGATSCSGIPEVNFNDNMAETLVKYLAQHAPAITSTLTRIPGQDRSLEERVTQSKGKDLFLSIHHDSVQPMYLEKNIMDGHVQQCCTRYAGFSIFVSKNNRYFEEAYSYAKRLAKKLISQGMKPSLHHAERIQGENYSLIHPTLGIYSADFHVIRKAQCPALLFEIGIIVNPEEEHYLEGNSAKDCVSRSVFNMVYPRSDQ